MDGLLTGFEQRRLSVDGVELNCRIGGQGPALLLLHGHPQTHVMWHRVAPRLAERFTLVAADLRGYGDSAKPEAGAEAYSKRTLARDNVELMRLLGPQRFAVVAPARGARVAHRLALDHPAVVERMLLPDIAPTLAMYRQTDEAFARAYWHWFFLIRPAPLPERLIEADPEGYLKGVMGTRSAGLAPFPPEVLSEYLRCLSLPGTGRRLELPLRILWGAEGTVGRCFDPLAEWRQVANQVSGRALPGGHYLAEELPDLVAAEALAFFG